MIACSKCRTPIPQEAFNKTDLTPCPHCRTLLQTMVFPAYFNPPDTVADASGGLMTDTEAGCFYHPQKKAVVLCERCGRFLCGLCDVELDGGHFCPACLGSGKKKNLFRNLENHRVLYDNIALALAVYPLVIFWLTLITAPISLYMVLRYWKAPTTIIGRTKLRFIAAFIISAMQLTGWSWFFLTLTAA